jgi:hypothetical protein
MKQIRLKWFFVFLAFIISSKLNARQKPPAKKIKESTSQADAVHTREIKKKQLNKPYKNLPGSDSINIQKQHSSPIKIKRKKL